MKKLIPLLCLIPHLLLAGTVTFQDDFNPAGRESAVLNGSETQSGKGRWTATPTLKLTTEDGKSAVTPPRAENFFGALPLPPDFKKLTVEADVHPVNKDGDGVDNNWVGIMIGEPHPPHPTWQNALMLVLVNDGSFQALAMYPEPGNRLKSGQAPGFNPDGMNHLRIEFNKAEGTVSMFVNKALIVDERPIEGLSLSPNFCGFGGFHQVENTPSVSNFSMTVEE